MKNRGLQVGCVLIVACLALGIGESRPVHAVQPTDIQLEVFAQTPIRLYTQPSLSAPVLREIGNGNRMTWNAVYQVAESRNWMFVELVGQSGWISPNAQEVGFADQTRITPGIDRSAIIAPAVNAMSLYQSPGRGNPIIATLPIGTQLRVIDGPVVTDLYTWWPVEVAGTGTRGFVVDTGRELQVITPLRVYGYQVCDNFDLKTWGAANWDGVLQAAPNLFNPAASVVCLASVKMQGFTTAAPFVVVLNRTGVAPATTDTLSIVTQVNGQWRVVYQASAGQFNRTERLSVHDLVGDGVPTVLWAVRADGTGGILNLALLRYNPATGQIMPTLLNDGIYKGSIQINGLILNTISAEPLPNEPNCCPSTARRVAYQYNPALGMMSPILDNTFRIPAGAN